MSTEESESKSECKCGCIDGNKFKCICCEKMYENDSYDFHRLCHQCFNSFDNQKMHGRFAPITKEQVDFYTESVKEFIASGRCKHSEQENEMKGVLEEMAKRVED